MFAISFLTERGRGWVGGPRRTSRPSRRRRRRPVRARAWGPPRDFFLGLGFAGRRSRGSSRTGFSISSWSIRSCKCHMRGSCKISIDWIMARPFGVAHVGPHLLRGVEVCMVLFRRRDVLEGCGEPHRSVPPGRSLAVKTCCWRSKFVQTINAFMHAQVGPAGRTRFLARRSEPPAPLDGVGEHFLVGELRGAPPEAEPAGQAGDGYAALGQSAGDEHRGARPPQGSGWWPG